MKRGRLAARLAWTATRCGAAPDKIAAYCALGLLAVFLVGAPVLSVFAGHRACRWSTTELQAQRSWREVTAVVAVPAGVASFFRWLLDRRRLAGWEADWNSVGPSGRGSSGLGVTTARLWSVLQLPGQ